MKMMVTSATGFVGSAVVRHLLQDGHSVSVLVRPNSNRKNLQGLSLEIHEGDLNDLLSLNTFLAGCDGLFHIAADYRLWTKDPQAIYWRSIMVKSAEPISLVVKI